MKRAADIESLILAAVAQIESVSALEIVVTLSPRAVPPTVPLLAAPLATAGLCLITYPLLYTAANAATVAANTLFLSALAALLVGTLPQLQRLLIPAKLLQEATLAAARAEFVRQAIFCTRERTGLLLYLSVFERRAVLLVDSGIQAMIPPEELEALAQEAGAVFTAADLDLTEFFALLQQLGERYIPKAAGDVNELADGLRS